MVQRVAAENFETLLSMREPTGTTTMRFLQIVSSDCSRAASGQIVPAMEPDTLLRFHPHHRA
jgi:hypothetical protein